jgi:hypothetical protein
MAKSRTKPKSKKKKPQLNSEAQGVILLALGILGTVALWSFLPTQPSQNWLGYLGHTAALGAQTLFGLASYLLPFYLTWLGVRVLKGEKLSAMSADHIYFLIVLGSACMLLTVFAESYPEKARLWEGRIVSQTLTLHSPYPHTLIRFYLGGFPAYYLFSDLPYINLQRVLSPIGTSLIFFSLGLVSFLLLTKVQIFSNAKTLSLGILSIYRQFRKLFAKSAEKIPSAKIY